MWRIPALNVPDVGLCLRYGVLDPSAASVPPPLLGQTNRRSGRGRRKALLHPIREKRSPFPEGRGWRGGGSCLAFKGRRPMGGWRAGAGLANGAGGGGSAGAAGRRAERAVTQLPSPREAAAATPRRERRGEARPGPAWPGPGSLPSTPLGAGGEHRGRGGRRAHLFCPPGRCNDRRGASRPLFRSAVPGNRAGLGPRAPCVWLDGRRWEGDGPLG